MSGAAIVTGAQRGIGRAIALAFADAGFDVAVVDLEASTALLEVANGIRKRGRKSIALACNIAGVDAHEALLADAEKAIGPLTVLINNAGVGVMNRGDLLDVSAESYDRCQSVNARGTFFLTQSFARKLIQTKNDTHRSIITITSSNVTGISIARGEYCISKAATSMMSRLFAARLSNEGIGVYEIQPGIIETDMTSVVKPKYDRLIDDGLTVIKRFGQPEEVARVAVTMAQGLLPYTVGQAVQVDGGLLSVRY
jgi:NAD(P)-dependent dehydrogenase (short-subunit alcohol dehydrogenase family)